MVAGQCVSICCTICHAAWQSCNRIVFIGACIAAVHGRNRGALNSSGRSSCTPCCHQLPRVVPWRGRCKGAAKFANTRQCCRPYACGGGACGNEGEWRAYGGGPGCRLLLLPACAGAHTPSAPLSLSLRTARAGQRAARPRSPSMHICLRSWFVCTRMQGYQGSPPQRAWP